jgi:hypothetical protein
VGNSAYAILFLFRTFMKLASRFQARIKEEESHFIFTFLVGDRVYFPDGVIS